jgi:hypothetical protein
MTVLLKLELDEQAFMDRHKLQEKESAEERTATMYVPLQYRISCIPYTVSILQTTICADTGWNIGTFLAHFFPRECLSHLSKEETSKDD